MDFRDDIVRTKIANAIRSDIFALEATRRPNRFSHRISPSTIGEDCVAKSWYSFRWATEPKPADGRMSRYNRKGEENETDLVEKLRATGWTVEEFDPATGKQWSISGYNGHMYGKIDGRASHPVHTAGIKLLLEFKYINYKRYSALTTKALIQADPKYYSQINLYMDELDLPACIFVPENRNDADIQPVVIPKDTAQVELIRRKAQAVFTSRERPARIAENPAYFECKFCEHVNICHHGRTPPKSCRSCYFAVPVDGGKWGCTHWNATIPDNDAIMAACGNWTPIK